MADFKGLKEEWLKGYEDMKASGDGGFYVFLTVFITLLTILMVVGLVALILAIAKSIFWYVVAGVVLYALGVKFFGFPVPSFLKKFVK